MTERTSVTDAERLVRSRFAAWNRADSGGLLAALHVPHVSLPGPRLSIRESERALRHSPDFRALASVDGWHSSVLDRLDIHQWSPDKAHCVVAFGRNAADGTRYANRQAVYVVTSRDGRWGIQLDSVTLRPIGVGVGGSADRDAVAAASNVLVRWVEARDGADSLAVRRLVHLPLVELDGARLAVHRSTLALRRDVARRALERPWHCSDVGPIEARERSASKVTLETEITRFERGRAPVAREHLLAIVTRLQGRWALQVHSFFLTSPAENRPG